MFILFVFDLIYSESIYTNKLWLIDILLMRTKLKVFVVACICGVLGVFLSPSIFCSQVDGACTPYRIVGYISFGIAGVIVAWEILKSIAQFCKCLYECCLGCCQACFECCANCMCCCENCLGNNRDRDESLIRNSIQQGNGYEVQVDYHEDIYADDVYPQPKYYNFEDPNADAFRQSFNQNQCTICLECYTEYDQVVRQICGHKYHRNCIDDWLTKSQNCPVCRQKLI